MMRLRRKHMKPYLLVVLVLLVVAMKDLQFKIRADDAEKIAVTHRLIQQHVDVDRILQNVEQ